jgi:hypothetical protein
MASTAELVYLPSTSDRPITGRSDSLNGNGSSLARRPRIPSRTRTLPEGSGWSDTTGALQNQLEDLDMGVPTAPRESQVAGGQIVAEPVQSVPPPRPPRSPKRSLFSESASLDVPNAAPRERKISSTSTRSGMSSRGAASLEELLALKNVGPFFLSCAKQSAHSLTHD